MSAVAQFTEQHIFAVLLENGLSEKEARVFLALLACGESTPVEVARRSGIKRPTTYLTLESLAQKGLATHAKHGRGVRYRALDPSNLFESRHSALQRLRGMLPAMSALAEQKRATPEMRVFEGLAGLRQVMEDTLSSRGEILCWVDLDLVTRKVFRRYWPEYVQKRLKKNLRVRAIMVSDETALAFKRRDKAELRESVLIPKSQFPLHGEMNIYNDKIAILSYMDPVGVIIQNQALADMQRSIFNLSFQLAKLHMATVR